VADLRSVSRCNADGEEDKHGEFWTIASRKKGG
jgi:hypothetical protein